MKRWRLIVFPLLVAVVGVSVAYFNRPAPSEVVGPSKSDKTDSDVSKNNVGEPQGESLDEILKRDPIRFFPMSLEKYDKTIQGYTHTFDKHERIKGPLRKPEKCEVRFREKPFSVFMEWKEGADQALRVLYVKDQNNDKLLARPNGMFLKFVPPQSRDVDGPDAKKSGRFTIAQFGFKQSTERTLASMKRAQDRGKLNLKYEGIVPVDRLKGKKCHKFVRTPYDPPEEDQLTELTVYYDTEHWLQVGAVLKDVKGELLGEYFFYNIEINPTFSEKQFTRDAL